MRHRKKGHKLGRTAPHRKRTLQALSNALIDEKRITTTVAKAKALRPFVEPLITRAKEDTQHNRRQVFRHLQNKEAVKELFGEVSDRVADRPGGYTRIIRLGQRSGDGAELAMIELVDYNDFRPSGTGSDRSGGTRRGSGKGRRDEESSSPAPQDEDTVEEPAESEAEGTDEAEASEDVSEEAETAVDDEEDRDVEASDDSTEDEKTQ